MAVPHFARWFAELLGQSELEVERLLRDRTAIQFLITWSLFESKCFDGYATSNKITPLMLNALSVVRALMSDE